MASKQPISKRSKQLQKPKAWRLFNLDESETDWLDRLIGLDLHFGRFVRDAIGVVLFACSAMVLLALVGGSNGVVLLFLTDRLLQWFGWGSYLIAISIGALGVVLLRWGQRPFSIGRIVAFEFLLLFTLGLMAVLGGNSLERADAGLDGGRIGWGLVFFVWMVAGRIGGTLLLVLLWILAIMASFGFWQQIENWLEKLAGESSSPLVVTGTEQNQEPVSIKVDQVESKKKKPVQLPPEFRKSLRVSRIVGQPPCCAFTEK